MAPAKTGRESRRRITVIKIDHTNKGSCSIFIYFGFMFKIVAMKLIAPRIDEIPAKCKEKIDRSTEIPPCAMFPERGGYTVHPVPAPMFVIDPVHNKISAGGKSQNLILFIRGKAISGALIMRGTSQLPNPPIIMGITMKKIIIKAWAVTTVL